jgi:SAM-dependent methyltransferase
VRPLRIPSNRATGSPRLYRDLAWTWPIISPPEGYVGEAEDFVTLIREHARIPTRTLLDLGCGGGHNDATFRRHFRVVGVDRSPKMLSLARALNPDVEYHRGDMRSVRLRRRFDAVVIADSINYMLTERELRSAFTTGFLHLRRGGVLATYAEHEPGSFEQNRTVATTHSRNGVHITLVEHSYDPDPSDTTFEFTMVFLIRRKGELEVHVDRHRNHLFPLMTWRRVIRDVGFELVELRRSFGEPGEKQVPTFIGIKPMRRAH